MPFSKKKVALCLSCDQPNRGVASRSGAGKHLAMAKVWKATEGVPKP